MADILIFLALFIGGAVSAAFKGDYSGVKFIGEILLGIAIFALIVCYPALLVIGVILLILVALGCASTK